jgi:hypothetical protein
MRKATRIAGWLSVCLLAITCSSQTSPNSNLAALKYQYKVGVLPFVDTTGTLEDKGTVIARLLQSELTHTSDLEVRFIKPSDDSGSDIDSDTAVKLARDHKNDVVVLATILTANVEESSHNAQGPSLFGQSLGGSSHSAKATVELQADLYSSVTGKKLDSIRVSGEEHNSKISGNVDTSMGNLGNGDEAPDSPLGKALQKAIQSLASRIVAAEPKMLRYNPGDSASSNSSSDN